MANSGLKKRLYNSYKTLMYRAGPVEGAKTYADWKPIHALLLRVFYGGCCYCGSSDNLTIDHVTPICRGGRNRLDNFAPACFMCNSTKNQRTLEEFVGSARAIYVRTLLALFRKEVLSEAFIKPKAEGKFFDPELWYRGCYPTRRVVATTYGLSCEVVNGIWPICPVCHKIILYKHHVVCEAKAQKRAAKRSAVTKLCRGCDTMKDLSEFGTKSRCRQCRIEEHRRYNQSENGRATSIAYKRSKAGLEVRKRYNESELGKEARQRAKSLRFIKKSQESENFRAMAAPAHGRNPSIRPTSPGPKNVLHGALGDG